MRTLTCGVRFAGVMLSCLVLVVGTLPADAQSTIRIATFGDYYGAGANTQAVANLVNGWNPDLIATVGDNTNDGSVSGYDNQVGQFYHGYIKYPAGSSSAYAAQGSVTNRFFPGLGNHDWDAGISGHTSYFELPGNERYYEYVAGPVHIFHVDSDSREADGNTSSSTQATWLQARLAASTSPWKLVFLHHPPYSSSSNHGNTPALQWPYQAWGATAVLAGHDHDYERIMKNGFPYFVVGTGGQTLYGFKVTPEPGSAARYNGSHGAMVIDASATTLTFEFYAVGGALIDRYSLGLSSEVHSETFNSFTVGQRVGTNPGWYDGGGGPVVGAANGVAGSRGLDSANNIFTWTAHAFNWTDPHFEKAIIEMDFQTSGSGTFDDDRVGWMTGSATVSSDSNFGVQLDPTGASGPGQNIETYWRNSTNSRVESTIVVLPSLTANAWYRLRLEVTKLGAVSAQLAVSLTALDGSGNPGAVVASGTRTTNDWGSGSAPDARYFGDSNFPAYKNYKTGSVRGAVDNAYAEFVSYTLPTFSLTVNVVGSGTVLKTPDKVLYDSGEVVTLMAAPSLGWAFRDWSGEVVNMTNPTSITMNAHKTVTASFDQPAWTAYNDCVYSQSLYHTGRNANGDSVHYRGRNITTFGIGSGFGGATSGLLVKQTDSSSTGVTAQLTQSGGVVWQPSLSSGGYDPAQGTDAYNTFRGIADMTGVVYYGPSAGWYVDLTLTGLDPGKLYVFAASAARGDATYTNRRTIFRISGADSYVNCSTYGVTVFAQDSVEFNTGYNITQGYVARWTNINPGSDGSFRVRARHGAGVESGYKAYAFSVFMLQELDAPLPIQLASFTACVQGDSKVFLEWLTISETNNYGFEVQRAADVPVTYQSIPNSFIRGQGTTLTPHTYCFTDASTGAGTWLYRLKQIDTDGTTHYSEPVTVTIGADSGEPAIPKRFALEQNYPNPFNPETAIRFSVEQPGNARLILYNILGQEVATLFAGVAEPGRYYSVKLDGRDLPSGVYFYRLESASRVDQKKMLLVK